MSDSLDRVIEGIPMFVAFPPNESSDGAAAKHAIKQSVSRIVASGEPEDIGLYRFDLKDHLGCLASPSV
ncbi:hypothetical protein [uncultured Roseobacter sp.]|uniref:hypothetical protein n=1 Tax=uncultured Roseobacter sp. TaxID=114847 RepID=UPI002632FA5C|nr:hypothetical protein [uncultured Roseobacter sp.]